jgi:hypothetical protein
VDIVQRKKIIKLVFGPGGLAEAKDIIEYEMKKENIDQLWPANDKRYMEKVTNQLLKHSLELHWNNHLELRWTNNNAESLNHVLKQMTNWKPQDLPKLLEQLKDLSQAQQNEVERSIFQRGQLKLVESLATLTTRPEVWLQMDMEKKKIVKTKVRRATNPGRVTSATGHLTVHGTPSKGRKPGQRKRPRTNRTEPVAKKKENTRAFDSRKR